jgi:hypothetical protein
MYKRLVAAALVFGMAATGPPIAAHAQINCGIRSQVIGVLKQQHRETILGVGLSSPNAIYEVWRAKKTGSWTILMTKPNNISCIMATGRNWMEAPKTSSSAAKASMIR